MKKVLFCCALALLGLCQPMAQAAPVAAGTAVAVAGVHPAEAKMDKLMETYVGRLQAAFVEQDDQKTIGMLNKASDEVVAQLEKLKPELETWINSMTAQDKAEFQKRSENKPYVKAMLQLMFDAKLMQRLQANPALQQALENASARFNAVHIKGADAEEEEDGR